MTATQKWEADLPLNLKELAAAQAVCYKTAVRWASDPTFPRVGRLVRKRDFLKWWKSKAELPAKASHRPQTGDCRSREQSPTSDSLAALPLKAERLLGEVASHS